jgi:hypothetical protein
MVATFDDKCTSLSGKLLIQNDVPGPNPVAIVGQRLEAATSRKSSWFPGCCVSPDVDAKTEKTFEMSAQQLFDVAPPNMSSITNNINADIMDAAYATYKQEWVDAVQIQDLTAGKEVPEHMKEMVKEEDVQQMLWDLVTAQVCGSVWDPLVERYWEPDFTSQQDVRNRAQYFLEGSDAHCMTGKKIYAKTFNRLRDYWYGQMTPGLQPYLRGEGGKTAAKWAWELAEYVFSDDAEDDLEDLLMTDPREDGQVAKLQHIISALTANSSDEQDQVLCLNFSNTLAKAFLNFCVENIGSLDLAAMTDIINSTLNEVWNSTQSPRKVFDVDLPDDPEVVSVLKSSFKLMGVESDSDIATKLAKYTSVLAKHFVDNATTQPKLSTKVSSWTDADNGPLKSVFPELSEEDFNQVASFSSSVMISVSMTVASYATTHEPDAVWVKESSLTHNQYIGMGVLVMNRTLRIIAKGTGIETLFRYPTSTNFWRWADPARVQAIRDAVNELRRNPEWALLPRDMDWQQFCDREETVLLRRYAAEIRTIRNGVEAQRRWLNGCVNWILGEQCRSAACMVASSFCMATAIYGLWNHWNDPWSIKSWEVAQVAVDCLAWGTNLYSVLGPAEIEATCIPLLGEVFAVAGATIAVVLIILKGSQLSPEQTWVRDVGANLLKTVETPTSDWLAEHPLPSEVQ